MYQKVWRSEGSPLLYFSQSISQKLQKTLGDSHLVLSAMRYGSPSMHEVLEKFSQRGIDQIKIIPLFPQFSFTTTGSIIEKIKKLALQFPEMQLNVLQNFYNHPFYITALSQELKEKVDNNPDAHILFSFHGLPERYIKNGDPYQNHCEATAHLIAKNLKLKNWSLSYQSQFGPEQWLQPSTEDAVMELKKRQQKFILIAPGFYTDCLETLEELDCALKEDLQLADEFFVRVSCLNDSEESIETLKSIINDHS